jgi:hypothetical protein
MSTNNGYVTYLLYNALRLHFTSKSYDFFKYHGKTNVSKESFLRNKSKYFFYKLSRKYSHEECQDFFVANFITHKSNWIGEMMTDDAYDTYNDWLKRKQSLTYTFQTDIEYIFDKYDPVSLIKVKQNEFPNLLLEVMQGKVAIESLIMLNDILKFLPMWERKITDDIIWPEWSNRLIKYAPFIQYDAEKIKAIIKKGVKIHLTPA